MTGQEEWQNFKTNLVDADFTLKFMNWASGVGRPVQGERVIEREIGQNFGDGEDNS